MVQKRRSLLFIPLVIVGCAVVGGLLGPRTGVAAAAGSDDDLKSSLKSFTKVYGVVEENFADPVSPDKGIYKGAIPGMLRTLDPHSNFFDSHDFQLMREEQKGKYSGVGMQVAARNGKTVVMAPFVGSPAYKAGLRPGDVIIKVDDLVTDNLSTTEVADHLKGDKGTEVRISVLREGSAEPIVFKVIRDNIKRDSVRDTMWLRPGIGYFRVELFGETTGEEVHAALKELGPDNIKGLVIDLRFNPGGLLDQAVSMAGQFLRKGDVVVSHHGRASKERVYRATDGNHGADYPIVILVNRYSASAAEIVSGALQDHDRAWILGDNTFGKGLVQTVFPLDENSGLALTTAKYYTPSGRLIQRDYSNVSFFDYYYKTNTEAKDEKDVKMTDSGRTVYGGGGISPDEKYLPPKMNAFQIELGRKYAPFNYARFYFASHSTKLDKGWTPDSSVIEGFHDYLLKEKYDFTEADFTANHDWISKELEREIYTTALGEDESRRFVIENDPAVLKAIDALPKARALQDSAKKVIAQRMAK